MSTIKEPEVPVLNVNLLLASFLKIEPQADDFATTFYYILFNKYPAVRTLFAATDMQQQKNKLIDSLQLVMGNVHNSEAFTTILKNLGSRHVQYGAVLTDYPLIGDALLQALEKHLGKDWTPDVKQTWVLAYQLIADTMTEGANSASLNSRHSHSRHHIQPQPDLPNEDSSLGSKALEQSRSTNSGLDSIFGRLILLVGLGIAGVCGYTAWNSMQSPTNFTPSETLERSK